MIADGKKQKPWIIDQGKAPEDMDDDDLEYLKSVNQARQQTPFLFETDRLEILIEFKRSTQLANIDKKFCGLFRAR